jgi:hypothetical protein
MNTIAESLRLALDLVARAVPKLLAIVGLSLRVSATACACAAPAGQATIADYRINGEQLFFPNAR